MKEKKGLIRALNYAAAGLERCINFFACLLLTVITLSVCIQVVGRTTNIPVVWLGELSTYSLIWVVFLGLAIGYRHGMFAQVDILCHIVPKSWTAYLSILWDIIGLVIMGAIIWSSREYIAHAAKRGLTSPELRLPLYIAYMGPVLGYVFTGYFSFVNIVNKTAGLLGGKSPAEEREEAAC